MASFTVGVIASRLPVITAEAIAPLSPGRTARMPLVDRLTHSVDHRGVPQPEARSMRHLGVADTAEHETGRADTIEVHVAREVVAARA